MSLAVRYGRQMYSQGDPGLFDFIGKAVKGIGKAVGGLVRVGVGAAKGFATGGPLGAVTGGLGAAIGKPRIAPMVPLASPGMFPGTPPLMLQGNQLQPGVGFQAGRGGVGLGYFPADQGTAAANQVVAAGGQCPVGFHIIRKGNNQGKCARNRHMNPLNPRALSRAMRRLTSAKKASRIINSISIRKKCPT